VGFVSIFVYTHIYICIQICQRWVYIIGERWGAGVETQKNVRGEVGEWVEYHLMSPLPRR